MKIVRLIARNERILKFVDLVKYNYSIKEITHLLRIRPFLLGKMNIDLEKITKEDAFMLLTIGAKEISSLINIKKYVFTVKEKYEIIKFNNFIAKIVNSFDLKDLKDYHICDIVINTGKKYFHLLDLKILTARKWLEILEYRPELLIYCDLNKFKQSDIFNSVELVCLFPSKKLDHLIKERNYQDLLSPLGWKILLLNKPDEYISDCCFFKLNETDWKNITSVHPHLVPFNPYN
jgi:hypothetical protein